MTGYMGLVAYGAQSTMTGLIDVPNHYSGQTTANACHS
jgi:hypothetical protein